jgi:tyrosyl-tRNA synthetase
MPNATDAAAEDAVQRAEILAGNAVDSLPAGALADKLRLADSEGRGLRVKLGIDPTAPDIHLGHAVVLRKLREFQDAGHRVVLIVGDYTARVGDPSGRSSQRPILSEQEIDENARTFQEQAAKILDSDPERLEVRRNSEWLDMPMADLLTLLATTTAAQLLERDDFAKRLSAREPISMLELLYPLLQGYDSVAVRSDVEVGGTDQKFNLLLGRDVQRAYDQPAQAILTMPILVGTDGRMKMSKSLGNQIGITDPPEEMYGKTMNIPDESMGEYYRLLLEPQSAGAGRGPQVTAAGGVGGVGGGADGLDADGSGADGLGADGPSELAPMDAKRGLARGLVTWLHSPEDAAAAERHFDRVHVEGGVPEQIEDAAFESDGGLVHLPALMAEQFGISRSQARRLIDEGGVRLGEDQLATGEHDIPSERAEGQVLRVGRRRFRRLRGR